MMAVANNVLTFLQLRALILISGYDHRGRRARTPYLAGAILNAYLILYTYELGRQSIILQGTK